MREIFLQTAIANVSFGFNNFTEAFHQAKSRINHDGLLVVFGSFFLISDCLTEYEKGELT
ncbi:hypothetical protein [Methylocucumis oryzae]|uniref:hypothetical protein n=1 Tax=Methylocucumis oryzae TaxID=1632867 RepID=UPI000D6E7B21